MPVNERYARQELLPIIGQHGQEQLAKSRVLLIGCGALGTTIANNLVRSGLGCIRIADRDIVELSNLQRQILFDEHDIGSPKAIAAANKLGKINSSVSIESIVDDVNYTNIESLMKTMNVVVDGTDNMLIRFLINNACVKHSIPWIYGGAIETYRMTMDILPSQTPCFRCLMPNIPNTGTLPTCDTVGVLNSIPAIIGSIESTEVLKLLLGKQNLNTDLLTYDVWTNSFEKTTVQKKRSCECCGKHDFPFLDGLFKEDVVSICKRGAIHIQPARPMNISFKDFEIKFQQVGDVENRRVVLRCKLQGYELNIFQNGRAIIMGTNDKNLANLSMQNILVFNNGDTNNEFSAIY